MADDTLRDPRWTDETLALVAKAAFVDWTGGERDGLPTGDHLLAHLTRTRWEAIARNVLAALADAGLLLPAGGKTLAEHGLRSADRPDIVTTIGEDEAREYFPLLGESVVRRTVHIGPWLPADQSGADDA